MSPLTPTRLILLNPARPPGGVQDKALTMGRRSCHSDAPEAGRRDQETAPHGKVTRGGPVVQPRRAESRDLRLLPPLPLRLLPSAPADLLALRPWEPLLRLLLATPEGLLTPPRP